MQLNTYTLNSEALASSGKSIQTTYDNIVFDGFSLNNGSTIICNRINYDDQGDIALNSFDYPRNDGGGILSRFYRKRNITAQFTLKADNAEAFNTLIDNFKKGIKKVGGDLDIKVNEETRRTKATVTNCTFDRQHYNITFNKVSVTFTAVEPFFYTIEPKSWVYSGKTASFFEEIDNAGSAEANPAFYFIFTGSTGITSVSITQGTKTITVANSMYAGDLLIIDSGTKSVKKNGVEIDYDGAFPTFPTGSNPFYIGFAGTVQADITLVLPKNYL